MITVKVKKIAADINVSRDQQKECFQKIEKLKKLFEMEQNVKILPDSMDGQSAVYDYILTQFTCN